VRRQIGDGKVLLGLSGGVDSSVVAALLHRAIGDRLTCVFVDNGLLRLHEGDQVMQVFARNLGVKVIRVDAEARFLDALAGVADPEAKRKIIGRLFIEVFDEQAAHIEGVDFLAQGTIYPDVIESAGGKTGKAQVIKSHHNVGGLPEHMQLKLVETVDFMTARWAQLPYELLDLCSRRIINEVPGLSRAVYDTSGKPPATIEWGWGVFNTLIIRIKCGRTGIFGRQVGIVEFVAGASPTVFLLLAGVPAAMVGIGAFVARRTQRQMRAIESTPAISPAAARPGLARVDGIAAPVAGKPLTAPPHELALRVVPDPRRGVEAILNRALGQLA